MYEALHSKLKIEQDEPYKKKTKKKRINKKQKRRRTRGSMSTENV